MIVMSEEIENIVTKEIEDQKSEESAHVPVFNRELSWLSFNYRVLQEAMDKRLPLYERLKFLAIYSSNLDEFFRVRVASLRSMVAFKEKTIRKLSFNPTEILTKVLKTVEKQQRQFYNTFREVVQALSGRNIRILNETELSEEQGRYVVDYFNDYVRPWVRPMLIIKNRVSAFLKNDTLYLFIKMYPRGNESAEGIPSKSRHPRYANVEIPTDHVDRFLVLPKKDDCHCVIFIDDIIRYNLDNIFPGYKLAGIHAIKMTRDAELNIDDEYSGNLVQKIRRNIEKRRVGVPARFSYDSNIPNRTLKYFMEAYNISKDDLMPENKYLNLTDLFSFPEFDMPDLVNENFPPLPHPDVQPGIPMTHQIEKQNLCYHVPFQSYNDVIRFLNEVARDPEVISIKITLYRVASESKVIKALRKAAEKGKEVIVFSEVKARFDELSNLVSAEKLEASGANVLYSLPGIKVHAKCCLVTKMTDGKITRFGYLATGNFNEKTAKLYGDIGIFTTDQAITQEMDKVFDILQNRDPKYEFKQLLVAPNQMRNKYYDLIDFEINEAKAGRSARIFCKMNSLEDIEMIDKLYEASQAGVSIRLIVRGICCLIPGVKNLSENIRVISIVDRYLEHARVFDFYHGGKGLMYLSSADWMTRNLNKRIEVSFPVKSRAIKKTIRDVLKLQWKDNVKARTINKTQSNPYKKSIATPLQSQHATYEYFLSLYQEARQKDLEKD